MPFTILQVSDTHLGAGTALFRSNFARLAEAAQHLAPELLVASGDVSLDGAGTEADLAYAAEQFRQLGPVLAVPGNHDVGDHPERAPQQPVTTERLDRFRRHFGRDRWVRDHANWRILGLNSQVMGAHPEEHEQAAMIAAALDTLGGRRLAVFIHKPFFAHDPAETVFDYWSVPPFARGPLRAVMDHPALRLVASGHLHVHSETTHGPQAARYAWAPSVAFVVAPEEQPGLPGTRPCGALLHRFNEDAVETTLVATGAMDRPFIHEVRHEAYPDAA
ncbi:MAG: metallophosphoesterase family protein [Janthinobacterium lividum]